MPFNLISITFIHYKKKGNTDGHSEAGDLFRRLRTAAVFLIEYLGTYASCTRTLTLITPLKPYVTLTQN
jgi:hypothetical protein